MKHKNKKNELVDIEVARTLQGLDNVEDIEAGTLFYDRFRELLELSDTGGIPFYNRLLSGFPVGAAVLGLIIVLNLVTVLIVLKDPEPKAVDRQAYIEVIASEYSQWDSYLISQLDWK